MRLSAPWVGTLYLLIACSPGGRLVCHWRLCAASVLTALGVAPFFPTVLQAWSMLVGIMDWAANLDEPSSNVYWTVVLAS